MAKKVVMLFVCLIFMKMVYAQESVLDRTIFVNYQNKSIQEILTIISTNYSISFYYNATISDLQKRVSINLPDATLKTVLDKLFENTSLVYQIEGSKVLLNTAPGKKKTVIHGYITDADSKETLIGAYVAVKNTTIGTTTNAFGFYSLSFSSLPSNVSISFMGYNDTTIEVNSNGDINLNIALLPKTITMQEVIVNSDNSTVNNSQTGHTKLTMNEVKSLPGFMGEQDVLKAIQLTPGIKSGSEASGGLYVRGGGPDQNLMLLDGATLYNTSHSMNLFSVFNPDAIKDVEINKSGFPARYGGRLSSVIDVKMKDGNMEKFDGELAIGYLTSKFVFEGPIIKDKTSFIISGRRTFLDLFTRWNMAISPDTVIKMGMAFYDASVKVNHKFSDKDRVFASFYLSGDGFNVKETATNTTLQYKEITDAIIRWQNYTGALRWNHVVSGRLFSNTTLTYSKFNLHVNIEDELDFFNQYISDYLYTSMFGSTIEDYGIRTDFDFFPNSRHSIKYGVSAQTHIYQPGISNYKLSYETVAIDTAFKYKYYSSDFFGYIEDDIELSENLKINLGMHTSMLITGDKLYPSLQPRVSLRYSLSSTQSIKASYSKMSQNIHLLTSGGQMLPLDLWVPSTDEIPPMNAHQYSLGYALSFFDSNYEFTAETYFKQMNNLIEYKAGADFTNTHIPWDEKVITGGKGKSYGLELFVRKKAGDMTGWVGYTLSRVDHEFDEIDRSEAFPYKFDKRHDLSVVAMYKINERIDISGSWVYNTGIAITFPEGTYPAAQNFLYCSGEQSSGSIQYFSGRNGVRMPDYHRLDLGINFRKEKKHGVRTWNISIYNVYARQNPFYIYATNDENGNRQMKQVYMYSILPSITWSYKFR